KDVAPRLSATALAVAPALVPTGAQVGVPLTPVSPLALPVAVPDPAPVAPPAPPPAPLFKDGTYSGWGSSRHGDIQATVVVEAGKIVSATITSCYTRSPCSRIAALPPEVVERQSAEVDYVSRATDSTYAFYYAILEAISKAK